MYVIRSAAGNIYPADTCVWRVGDATNGGYKLTHLDINKPNVAVGATPTAATAGDELGYIGKTGRFTAITAPAT